jgi:hypothetical protein
VGSSFLILLAAEVVQHDAVEYLRRGEHGEMLDIRHERQSRTGDQFCLFIEPL